jgi:3-hydroxybutyrate dehydrogenase
MLKERRALVTGSTGGLGLAIAEGLARAGCHVALHGLEPEDKVAATCKRLERDHGVKAAYVPADLSSEAGARELVDRARAAVGVLDIVVNNAVVRHFAPIESFPVAEWERALAVNLSAAFHLVRLTLPGMKARGWGRIVNMSSVYGSRGTTNRVDYVTTKTAILGFTRAVAMETVGRGITCNAVCPGSVLTPAIDARVAKLAQESGKSRAEAEREFLAGKQPTGQFVSADHVADLVVFLCGPSGRDVTGAMLPVEGGWLAG